MSPAEIIDIAKEYLKQQPDVSAAYIFGSVAKGSMRARSDVDVAVFFSTKVGDKLARFDRRLELEMALQDRIHRPVQIVDFEAASPVLKHEIMKSGVLVVDNDPTYRVAQEVSALRKYLDFKPTYDSCVSAALRRL
ncbi:MAG: nucleotidyltransferase domain-containing protein [Candidatus Desulforudis sp.]|nr:nucleotidyltransferase domain-containing protein [Bacillota bacterium]MBV1727844.1 nucleotidyltransferase domain-containing protein [Desulforudis sp.]MDQ7792044.1 nucleotidyltransferase domain-containing protein [Clostridia bacterium]MBU4554115.1 nucleotidyltransferase domain-containing protein [Bacillota bacterium]MBV1734594.1 nucleotidyltransferase domain-containing protein [Desulforudis sp.]